MEWASFLKHHDLQPSMSRRGRELIEASKMRMNTPKVCHTCDAAHRDLFEYIEMLYSSTRKHTHNGMLSLIEFERQHKTKADGV